MATIDSGSVAMAASSIITCTGAMFLVTRELLASLHVHSTIEIQRQINTQLFLICLISEFNGRLLIHTYVGLGLTNVISMMKYFIFRLSHNLPVVFSATNTRHFILSCQPTCVYECICK